MPIRNTKPVAGQNGGLERGKVAPEIHQACNGWCAGIEASRKLRELVTGHSVVCEDRGYDRYGRMIGLCRADGVDIQAAMVPAGMAWAFVK